MVGTESSLWTGSDSVPAVQSSDVPGIRAVLLSLDIDGTLEDGDPPGPVTMELARRAIALGYVVGTASDRTLSHQRSLWAKRGIEPAFVSHKHTLEEVALRFPALRRVHVGDTHVDEHYAKLAGFEFFLPPAASDEPCWVERLDPTVTWSEEPCSGAP
jgi:hypothetical protein